MIAVDLVVFELLVVTRLRASIKLLAIVWVIVPRRWLTLFRNVLRLHLGTTTLHVLCGQDVLPACHLLLAGPCSLLPLASQPGAVFAHILLLLCHHVLEVAELQVSVQLHAVDAIVFRTHTTLQEVLAHLLELGYLALVSSLLALFLTLAITVLIFLTSVIAHHILGGLFGRLFLA